MSNNQNIKTKIGSALNKIRPMLQSHGGDVELVDFEEKTGMAKVRLQGHCLGCPMSQITLQQGIEETLKQEVPEVKKVEAV